MIAEASPLGPGASDELSLVKETNLSPHGERLVIGSDLEQHLLRRRIFHAVGNGSNLFGALAPVVGSLKCGKGHGTVVLMCPLCIRSGQPAKPLKILAALGSQRNARPQAADRSRRGSRDQAPRYRVRSRRDGDAV